MDGWKEMDPYSLIASRFCPRKRERHQEASNDSMNE